MNKNLLPPWLRNEGAVVYLQVLIQPGARKNEIVGSFDNRLKIKIAAPPVEGAANEELVSFLAKMLRIKKSAVAIYRGALSKQKTVEVRGVEAEEVARALQLSS